jgi:ABC-type nickel/cobalt efflux system permease component RcnA
MKGAEVSAAVAAFGNGQMQLERASCLSQHHRPLHLHHHSRDCSSSTMDACNHQHQSIQEQKFPELIER